VTDPKLYYSCPECGSLDVETHGEGIKRPDGTSAATATCPVCGWSGALKDTVGFATTERVFDTERLAEVMFRTITKHAAGPLVQLFELTGILPPIMDEVPPPEQTGGQQWTDEMLKKHNELAQKMRDAVMRATFESALTSAFATAEQVNRQYATEMNTPLHAAFREEEPSEEVFGGDVVSLSSVRKKKKKRKKGRK
jgi:hypothetical protein